MIEVFPDEIRELLDQPGRDAQLVLSDWLIERGDPWGTYIATADNEKQAAALWRKHGAVWCEGFDNHRAVELEWRDGFIRSISVYGPQAAGKDLGEDERARFAKLLVRPQCCRLEELRAFGVDGAWFETWRGLAGDRVRIERVLALNGGRPWERRFGPCPLEIVESLEPERVRWVFEPGDRVADYSSFPFLEVVTTLHGLPNSRAMAACPSIRRVASLRGTTLHLGGTEILSSPNLRAISGAGPEVQTFLDGMAVRSVSTRQRAVEVDLFLGANIGKATTTDELLAALDSNLSSIRQRAFELLEKRLPDHLEKTPLASGDVVARLGRCDMPAKELKGWFEAIGVALSTRVNKKTTHVIVGHQPGGRQLGISPDVRIILPSQLRNPLGHGTALGAELQRERSKAKAAAAEQSVDVDLNSLRERLDPGGSDSTKAAAIGGLEAMGGVPDALWSDVVFLLQTASGPLKKQIAALIKQAAPVELLRLLDKYLPRSIARYGIGKSEAKLAQLGAANCAVFDVARFAELLFASGPTRGAKYLLERGSERQRRVVIDSLAEAYELHRGPLIGFGDTIVTLGGYKLKALPVASFAAAGVTALDLGRNQLKALPAEFGSIRSLQALDLSQNLLEELPDSFASLEAIQYLDLSENRFVEFPRAILSLAKLETLDLTAPDVAKRLTAIPAEITRLRRLKHLTLSGHPIESLPAELFAMPSLRGIVMHGSARPSLPPIADRDRERLTLLGDCFAPLSDAS